MGVAQAEFQVLTLLLDTVADTEDFHLDGVALGHANNGVVQQGAGQTVQRTVLAVVIRAGDGQYTVFQVDGDRLWNVNALGALWALNLNVLAVDLDFDAVRYGDWC